jgi:hypothetical protein
MSDITSRPYKPDPAKCCSGCVFGGVHEPWCTAEQRRRAIETVNLLITGGFFIVPGQRERHRWGYDRTFGPPLTTLGK